MALLLMSALGTTGTAEEASDPLRPAAITTTNVPTVPVELTKLLDRYQDMRGAGFRGWSPTGDGILIATRFANVTQLHHVPMPGGRRAQLTFFEEPVGGGYIPKAKDGAILLSMSQGGTEDNQIYRFEPESGDVTLLTDGESKNGLGPITEDGQRLAFTSNKRNGKDTDIYMMDPRDKASVTRILETDGEYWWPSDWSKDGKRLLIVRFVSITESYPAILHVESGKVEALDLPQDPPASYGDLRFSPDEKHIYFTSDAEGEFRTLGRYNLETKRIQWLTKDIDWGVTDIVFDKTNDQLAFVTNEDGMSKVSYVGQDGNRRELGIPMGLVGSVEFSPDGEHLGFTLLRPTAPGDAYSLRLADEELTRWTYSEVGGLNTENFVEPELIRFKSFDDQEIPAYCFVPKKASAKEPVPVIIDIHGGPESQYRPYFSGIDQFYVNEFGIAVIHPNVRGSTGYGKTFTKLDNQMKREDSVKDIGALIQWVKSQDRFDSERIAVVGGSYGGYMVLASMIHFNDQLRAGFCFVGISNFITFLENTSPYRVDLRRVEYGDERDPEMRAFFEKINPTSRAEEITSALFLAHGVNDPRVPVSEAQQIATKVRKNGTPVWELYAENEGHGFAKKDNRDYLQATLALFLQEHLLK